MLCHVGAEGWAVFSFSCYHNIPRTSQSDAQLSYITVVKLLGAKTSQVKIASKSDPRATGWFQRQPRFIYVRSFAYTTLIGQPSFSSCDLNLCHTV